MKYALIFVIVVISVLGSYCLGYSRGEEVRRNIDFDKSMVEIARWSRDWKANGGRTDWDAERVQKNLADGLDFNKWYYSLGFYDSKSNKREAQFVKEFATDLIVPGWKPYLEVLIITEDSSVLEKKELTKLFGSYGGRVNVKDGWAIIQTKAAKGDVLKIADQRIQKLLIISDYK